ncbi:MAG: plastocyanin/azurin family copper-binding protein [Actinomycetota bacterium]
MRRPAALILALLLGALVGTACGGSSDSEPAPEAPPVDLRGRAAVRVVAVDNRFEPARIRIDPGTAVTWVNEGAMAHNVRKAADALDFGAPFGVDTADFGPGAEYTFRFTEAGVFPYACTIHTLMNGVVVVGAAPFPVPASGG